MKKIDVHLKAALLISLLALIGATWNAKAQETQPRIKLGAYYFAGWAGKCPYDDGKPEHAWAKGMPTHYTKKLATDFAGRTPVWGWRDDTQELMERQIDLAADNGVAYFSFCWYWHDNKGPLNVKGIDEDPKHLPMRLFMQAKNNQRMEFCLLVANHAGYEIVGLEAWKQAADYWLTLSKHPRYLRVDGKPIFLVYRPLQLPDAQAFAAACRAAFAAAGRCGSDAGPSGSAGSPSVRPGAAGKPSSARWWEAACQNSSARP